MWHKQCLFGFVLARSLLQLVMAIGFLARLQAGAGVLAEIPLQSREGFLWLKVHVAGHGDPLNFILDSGAASSVVDITVAKQLKVKLGQFVSVQGVFSQTTGRRISQFSAQTAGISVPERIIAFDLRAIGAICHQRVDGLLGSDFFQGRIVEIDYRAMTMRILSRAEPDARSTTLPMRISNGSFCIPVTVSGSRPQWMRVDTGCDSAMEWVTHRSGQEKFSGSSIGLTAGSAGKAFKDVQLGKRTLKQVETGLHGQQMFAGEDGLLGNRLLARFRVTFDVPRGLLFLEGR